METCTSPQDQMHQVPRLTSMLRTLRDSGGATQLTSSSTDVNVGVAFIERQELIKQRAKASSAAQAVGESGFAQRVLGPWKSVPKQARLEFDKFLQGVAQLVGEEVPPELLQGSAGIVWDAVVTQYHNPKNQRRGTAAAVAATKDAIQSSLGPIDDSKLSEVIEMHAKVQEWQRKIGITSRKGGSMADQKDVSGAAVPGTRDFGWDIDFRPVNFSCDPHEAVLAMCSQGTTAQHVHDRPAPGIAPNTQVLQQMVRDANETDPRPHSSSATYMPLREADGDLDDDLMMPKASVNDSQYGAVWLRDWCSKVTGGPPDDDLIIALCRILFTVASGDECAAQLFELLGDAALDHCGDLMPHRAALVNNLKHSIAQIRASDAASTAGGKGPLSQTLSITTAKQKELDKLERKERRKGRSRSDKDGNVDWLMVNHFSTLVEKEIMESTKESSSSLMIGGLEFRIAGADDLHYAKALPANTKRRSEKGYEEVTVPAVKPGALEAGEKLVAIEEMPEWAQLAFAGYKSLNRIQSRIYNKGFNSNENILVCAPTGAGKTNIAMIAVLREIGSNMTHGVIQKSQFKIVYVAPMKALAAEVTATFSKRLEPLGLVVRELTGDMQLSKKELAETQMIVTTPEKWDVITRKGGDVSISAIVRLLIVDEVHLLNDDRGAVIESLIARTKRQVESTQSMIRIVGLSATLPNYKDVGAFLGVSETSGLFYFDSTYRPVPLEMQFVGVSEKNMVARNSIMDEICYRRVVDSLRRGHQAMVFVHARKDTGRTARMLQMKSQQQGEIAAFDCSTHDRFPWAQKDIKKSRNREVVDLFPDGVGIHHAGMLRADRSLMERLFADGLLKVLCCTATLAWGVNLPAHTVIIKGTQVYNAAKGRFTELGMLDVQQIFGRAGRPQYQDTGEGIIITTHDKLSHYLGMLTSSVPIESRFQQGLVDNLNAEIVLGTVTNVREAALWLSYTYMHVRMAKNPFAYGIDWDQVAMDPMLESRRRELISAAARELEQCRMARFDERSGNLYVTELGRVASHFYIKHATIVVFNEQLTHHMTDADVLNMMAQSAEFENVAVREEELPELERMCYDVSICPCEIKGGVESKHGKVNVLMQAYVSRCRVESFSLIADMMYVSQNAPRIARALFEICLRRGWSVMSDTMLTLCKCFELRLWSHQHPLRQFENVPGMSPGILNKLEDKNLSMDRIKDMDANEIGTFLRHPAAGPVVKSCAGCLPSLHMECSLQPITRTVLRVKLTIKPEFTWKDRAHGNAVRWYIMVEDSENNHIYHSELWTLTKKMMAEEQQLVGFTIPIFEPLPTQYIVRVISEHWLHSESLLPMSFKHIILPERHPPHTELLDLDPLPLSALDNPQFESLYSFSHFNPIQTQAFHTLYHSDESVLVGAPTGSGKTITSELTMLRLFREYPDRKVIYIAPLKALVRERINDWGKGLCVKLNKKMVELTGDYTPDLRALLAADIIICTPEKWDGISRNWQTRGYVKRVGLLVIDEIHLLGADRGPILEVIVSRMRYISSQTGQAVRFVGLSTALANAHDVATWLGIGPKGLFNFKPSVRPVPLEVHIQGYPGKFYCPRMASMTKPAYAAIQTHSPFKPVLVFVSSRRQTRLTALDLIAYAAADERPRQFVHMTEEELDAVLDTIKDSNLRHSLQFGVGLHHAGLNDKDRSAVEHLYVAGKIQVLVATSTLAWGVNTPAHLVIIKGTEYFDAPTKRYVDFPITDVLQMMGRAGRPQFDQHGLAVIMVHEPKKGFYKKFLYEPFPVESSLPGQIADHFNAEVVSGTIRSTQDCVDYLTWTYFFCRLLQNPSFYDLQETDESSVSTYLSDLVERNLKQLAEAGCVALKEEGSVEPLPMGRIASYYYLKHNTMATFSDNLHPAMDPKSILMVMCAASEYDELPVRHNEDKLNTLLAQDVRWAIDTRTADDPHTKAQLLLQAHMGHLALPITDYITDTKSVLDNSLRVLQAIVDVASDAGWLVTALNTMRVVQSLMQARWPDDSSLLMLPHITGHALAELQALGIVAVPQLMDAMGSGRNDLHAQLSNVISSAAADDIISVCDRLPVVTVRWHSLQDANSETASPSGETASPKGDTHWSMHVELVRENGRRGTGPVASPPRVYAPRFPKIKEEGWWLVVGDVVSQELLAVKRISFGARTTAKLSFVVPRAFGRKQSSVTLYCMSDSYLGLDQQYEVGLPGKMDVSETRAGASGEHERKVPHVELNDTDMFDLEADVKEQRPPRQRARRSRPQDKD